MFLKMMGPENVPDNDSRKTFQVISKVHSVQFERAGGKAFALVYTEDDPDGESEKFECYGNCYLMNAEGRTIAQFGVAAPSRAA